MLKDIVKKLLNGLLGYLGYHILRRSTFDYLVSQTYSLEKTPTKQINVKQIPTRKSNVFIDDYNYNPKARPSFSKSYLSRLLLQDLEKKKNTYEAMVHVLLQYKEHFQTIPLHQEADKTVPHWIHDFISPIDGCMIYATLVQKNPRYYVECGSGNTTKFAARAIQEHNLRTKILSIDPFPRAEIDSLCDKLFRVPFEDMDLGFFSELSGEDIFIIDNSHRAFSNSDVTVFFTEVLPELPAGLLYAIHDIGFPYENFPERYYNEQYMLASYIIGGMMNDTIYFPTALLAACTPFLHELDQKMPLYPEISWVNGSGFFWMERGEHQRI